MISLLLHWILAMPPSVVRIIATKIFVVGYHWYNRLINISLYYIVPTSQSEVTVMQSYDNQPRQDDESDQVTNTEG